MCDWSRRKSLNRTETITTCSYNWYTRYAWCLGEDVGVICREKKCRRGRELWIILWGERLIWKESIFGERESSDSEGHYVSSALTSSELNILLINLVQKLFFYLVFIRDVLITNFSDLKVKELKTIFCLLYLF